MDNRTLHIISFDVPYPANYGGVIDVFHKIRWLHKKGVRVILHCFDYGKGEQSQLNQYCKEVHYYPRKTGWNSQFSFTPYIVQSRRNKSLLNRLLQDEYPILFEGLHSTYLLNHPELKNRNKIVRAHNIEHGYYRKIAEKSSALYKKLFHYVESIKLKFWEKKLSKASTIISINNEDYNYFKRTFPSVTHQNIPTFHTNDQVNITAESNRDPYFLYHGNLSVPENKEVAQYLIKNWKNTTLPLIIAGLNPDDDLVKSSKENKLITLKSNCPDKEMFQLIRDAYGHIMFTFQATGLKLKLINVLFNGKHVFTNKEMLHGTNFLTTVTHCEKDNLIETVKLSLKTPFSTKKIQLRKEVLAPYMNEGNADRLIEIIFK